MNKFLSLTKIQVIDFFSKYTQQLNVKNKYLGILVMFLPILLIFPATQMVLEIYNSFLAMGFPELTVTYMYIANTILMVVVSIPFIISVFFYSKDLRLIATLPVKEDTIVFSKLASVYIYLLAISSFFLGTAVVIYGTIGELNLSSLIVGIIALIISPLIPMIIATIIILPFMSVIGSGKRRNLMVVVGNMLLLGAIIVLQMLSSKIQLQPEELNNILLQEDGLLMVVGRRFPPSIWLTKMIQGSIVNGVLFIGLNVVLVLILKTFAKTVYSKALMKFNQEGDSIRGGKIYYKSRNKGLQMIKRHINIIISNPVFLMNTVLTIFMPILMFIIILFTGEIQGELLKSTVLFPYHVYIFSAIITTPAIIGSLSATVITREGKTFWETKVLPISARDNIKYRIYTTLIIKLVASLILGIMTIFIIPVNLQTVLVATVFCITSTLFFSSIDIVINIERPLLNWSNPTAAVKNNLNILLALLLRLVVGVIGYGLYKLIDGWEASVVMLVFSGLFIILYFISIYIVYGMYEEKFIDIAP
ncbi:hypothetical protein GC105_06640 [Alkalibaculum sp. M08DMB]|uniref:Uncharacterized protein n=1 Tax=Alkalibaculum sporogenes TaxID=2655001 RepID=A0A6A7K804_9FIRM|nr:hypothetical protein [Alkalibaculum sporogenes]MPW25461.1 hypothetical protein [Alkalibaculum sporogenes]